MKSKSKEAWTEKSDSNVAPPLKRQRNTVDLRAKSYDHWTRPDSEQHWLHNSAYIGENTAFEPQALSNNDGSQGQSSQVAKPVVSIVGRRGQNANSSMSNGSNSGAANNALPELEPAEFKKYTQGMVLLSLFHGFYRPKDGIEAYASEHGVEVEAWDVENSAAHDLADEGVWETIRQNMDDRKYSGAGGGPPCSSFSATRTGEGNSPKPLRGEWPPELFGLPGLDQKDKEMVRLGTLLAHRMAEACKTMIGMDLPCWAETPAHKRGILRCSNCRS